MKYDFSQKLKNFFERNGKVIAVRNKSELDITADMKEFLLAVDAKNKSNEEEIRKLIIQIENTKDENDELKKKIKYLDKYKQIIEEIKLRYAVLGTEEDHKIIKKLKSKNADELYQINSISSPVTAREQEEIRKVLRDFGEIPKNINQD